MDRNDKPFLYKTLSMLTAAQLPVWIFGGWAEELWGIIRPRAHRDIDLLFLAPDFSALERSLASHHRLREIEAKRFPHKRAFLHEDVMVEFFLVQQSGSGAFTDVFDRRRFRWPPDTFSYPLELEGRRVWVASPSALAEYRAFHPKAADAYQDYLASL